MKQFYCGAVIPGCQARFTGEDEQAIPLLCCDDLGHYQGVIRVERIDGSRPRSAALRQRTSYLGQAPAQVRWRLLPWANRSY